MKTGPQILQMVVALNRMYPQQPQIGEVRALLRSTFGYGTAKPATNVVRPGTQAYDDERMRLHEEFCGKTWWEISYELLCCHRDSIPLFSIDGFTYFIPAFMCACLDFEHPETYDMCSAVLMALNPIGENGELVRYTCSRLNRFTIMERIAVAKFVALFVGVEGIPGNEARLAFSGFWDPSIANQ